MNLGVRVPATECPSCKRRLDGAGPVSPDAPAHVTPSPGDPSVCMGCGAFLIFTEDLHLRLMLFEEFEALPAEVKDEMRTAGFKVSAFQLMARDYTVWQFYTGGSCGTDGVKRHARDAVARADELTKTLAAATGSTCRIVIIDGADRVVWEWRHGEGLVFPKPARAN